MKPEYTFQKYLNTSLQPSFWIVQGDDFLGLVYTKHGKLLKTSHTLDITPQILEHWLKEKIKII